jgi:serine beta-lactamase-like protein LACTB, mitochondrial
MNVVALNMPTRLQTQRRCRMDKNRMMHRFTLAESELLASFIRLPFDHKRSRCHGRCCLIHGIFLLLMTVPQLGVCEELFSHNKQVDAAVIAEMERQHIVGAAIGIIQNSKIVYTRGYGWSDLKSHTLVTDKTIFNWASNSKPLMSIAALQLAQNGKLDLDRPIAAYCPHLPTQLQRVTSRQLLCHQSGIPHYFNGPVIPFKTRSESARQLNPLDELDPRKSIDRFILSPLRFKSGSQTSYSSYAYVLLTAVVQAAGNAPIDVQLKNRILDPLDLESFQLDLPLNQQANWTLAYQIKNGKPEKVSDYAHFWKHGAGGYKSNVKDFARFATALVDSKLIDQSTSTKMWTRQSTRDGKESIYGLGVVVTNSGHALKVSHSGSQNETRTRMVIYPHRNHGLVVMCNTQGSDPTKITTAIYSALNASKSSHPGGLQIENLRSKELQAEAANGNP